MSDEINMKKILDDYKNQSFETCIADTNTMLKKLPKNKTLLNIQGMSYFNLGKFNDSISTYKAEEPELTITP